VFDFDFDFDSVPVDSLMMLLYFSRLFIAELYF
jgi:hypothetical protein